MGSLYLIGAFLYAFRIPERYLPGKFDIFFHSHQIFHLLIVLAAYTHYEASKNPYHTVSILLFICCMQLEEARQGYNC